MQGSFAADSHPFVRGLRHELALDAKYSLPNVLAAWTSPKVQELGCYQVQELVARKRLVVDRLCCATAIVVADVMSRYQYSSPLFIFTGSPAESSLFLSWMHNGTQASVPKHVLTWPHLHFRRDQVL